MFQCPAKPEPTKQSATLQCDFSACACLRLEPAYKTKLRISWLYRARHDLAATYRGWLGETGQLHYLTLAEDPSRASFGDF